MQRSASAIIDLASEYEPYGYRRVTALLRTEVSACLYKVSSRSGGQLGDSLWRSRNEDF